MAGCAKEGLMARKERILVVDDDPPMLDYIASALEAEGYTVERAADGPTGLKHALAAPPDLVVLDVVMPGMDGLTVCDRLRFDPRTREVPIIFLSAKGDEDTAAIASVLDAYAFIEKPFEPHELLSEVRNCLNIFGRTARDDNRGRKGT